MKKAIAVGFLVTLWYSSVQAQQKAQYSQYMINQYVLNPALTGASDYGHIVAGYRNQWTTSTGAFDGALPKTYYISGHSSIGRGSKKPHPYRNKHMGYHGVGGMVSNDQTGPTSRLGILGSYAYNERLSGSWRISLGISAGVQQYTLNGPSLEFADSEPMNTQRKWVPDGNIGGWVYNKHFYAGAAVAQIFQSRLGFDIPVGNGSTDKISKLANHYFFTTGIKLDVSKDWAIIPSVMMKFNNPAPVSLDINAKVRYKDMIWLGTSYRNKDAFAFLFGVVLNSQFEFGYSYDLTVSQIKNYTNGSHEFMLGYRIWPRARIGSPSDFW